jgi:hypothetical protein
MMLVFANELVQMFAADWCRKLEGKYNELQGVLELNNTKGEFTSPSCDISH